MVDVISDVGCEAPVVGAVLEQIQQRHSRVRESVNEDGFEKSLRVVNAPTSRSNATRIDQSYFKVIITGMRSTYCAVVLMGAFDASP